MKKCRIILTAGIILCCCEVLIFHLVGDEPIPTRKYPFVVVNDPVLYNNGFKPTTTTTTTVSTLPMRQTDLEGNIATGFDSEPKGNIASNTDSTGNIATKIFGNIATKDDPAAISKGHIVAKNIDPVDSIGKSTTPEVDKLSNSDVQGMARIVSNQTKPNLDIVCKREDKLRTDFFKLQNHQVNAMDFKVLIGSGHTCDPDTFLVIVVHSLHNHTEKRQLIRDTWGSVSRGLKWPGYSGKLPKIQLYFLFGEHRNSSENERIRTESSAYNDVIQFDFAEDYRNMTYKNIMGLHWLMNHCNDPGYVLKADDDIFANLPAIVKMLQTHEFTRTIIGPYNPYSETVRYPPSKWFLNCSEYPYDILPPYMSGSGYILTRDIVHELYITSLFVPLLHVDDVYVTGILGKIIHVEYAYSAGGFIYASYTPPSVENLKRDDVYTRSLPLNATLVYQVWRDLETYEVPSRLRAETIVLMFFAVVFVGFCFACMCALEMEGDDSLQYHSTVVARYEQRRRFHQNRYGR